MSERFPTGEVPSYDPEFEVATDVLEVARRAAPAVSGLYRLGGTADAERHYINVFHILNEELHDRSYELVVCCAYAYVAVEDTLIAIPALRTACTLQQFARLEVGDELHVVAIFEPIAPIEHAAAPVDTAILVPISALREYTYTDMYDHPS